MGKIEASRLFSNSAAAAVFGQASDLCSRSRVRPAEGNSSRPSCSIS